MKTHYQILFIGGGTAGIMTSAYLRRQQPGLSMAIIEPSKDHYYQAAFTLVGAGTFDIKNTRKDEKDMIPKGVDWIQDFAEQILPADKKVTTRTSGNFTYDYLVVAPGLVNDLDALPGLRESINKGNVCSNYTNPEYTWEVISNFKGGNALFTLPSTPIKCGGAPQKIMYLAEEAFARQGVRKNTNVIYASPGSVIFGVKEFAPALSEVVKRKGIVTRFFYAPVKIDSAKKEVHFKFIKPESLITELQPIEGIQERFIDEHTAVIPYEMLHLAPPQAAPDFIRHSALAHQEGPMKGWLQVDINSLQHVKFPEIFGIGDVAGLPTGKTGAAVRKQAGVVANNILRLINNKGGATAIYNGYSSCPLVTGYGKMLLAEFKYDNVRASDPLLSKIWDTTKEQYSMWILKKYGLPYLYWNQMMKGKMIG